MNEGTRRTVRTIYQIVVALVFAVPVILVALPTDVSTSAVVVAFAAWVAIITKVINTLEDAGLIPAWLKGTPDGEAPFDASDDTTTPADSTPPSLHGADGTDQ